MKGHMSLKHSQLYSYKVMNLKALIYSWNKTAVFGDSSILFYIGSNSIQNTLVLKIVILSYDITTLQSWLRGLIL